MILVLVLGSKKNVRSVTISDSPQVEKKQSFAHFAFILPSWLLDWERISIE